MVQLEFLHSKFGPRMFSRRLDLYWPANSPDLSSMDIPFWSQASVHLKRVKSTTLEGTKAAVEQFAATLDEDAVRIPENRL